jgi:NAD(P)-dependent dehydrogenase (short-subunit alcohol dehydrogenase family)
MRLNCDFTNRVCVVTGATRGLGYVLAKDYAAYGGRVVGAGRNKEAFGRLAREIGEAGGTFVAVEADLSSVDGCKHLIDRALDSFGQIDVLVNNAAVTGQHKLIRDLDPAEWQQVIDLNLTGTYACIHFAVGSMMDRRSGAIVNVSSAGTSFPSPRRSDYIGSKGGMVQLTRVLAHELGPYNIRVNTVTPGFIDGERAREAQSLLAKRRGVTLAEVEEEFLSASPLHRKVPPEDISNLICFLTSDFGATITGQNIHVDAGLAFN